MDIETDLNSTFIWLVGLHLEAENRTYSFYADTPEHEKQILSELIQFLTARRDLSLLSYSGCRIEERMLAQRLAAHGLANEIASSIRDLYFDIHSCFAFPTQALTLKEVAKSCGFTWRDSGMDGFAVAALYGRRGRLAKQRKQMVIR